MLEACRSARCRWLRVGVELVTGPTLQLRGRGTRGAVAKLPTYDVPVRELQHVIRKSVLYVAFYTYSYITILLKLKIKKLNLLFPNK
jgi:hypothetical protein